MVTNTQTQYVAKTKTLPVHLNYGVRVENKGEEVVRRLDAMGYRNPF